MLEDVVAVDDIERRLGERGKRRIADIVLDVYAGGGEALVEPLAVVLIERLVDVKIFVNAEQVTKLAVARSHFKEPARASLQRRCVSFEADIPQARQPLAQHAHLRSRAGKG